MYKIMEPCQLCLLQRFPSGLRAKTIRSQCWQSILRRLCSHSLDTRSHLPVDMSSTSKSKYGADAISEASVQSVPWSRPQLHTQVRHGTTSSTNHSAVLCAVERGVQVDRNKQEKVCIKAWCALTMTYTQDVHISADKIPKRKTCLKLVRSWNKGNARPHPNAACHRHHIWQETWPAETNHMKPCSFTKQIKNEISFISRWNLASVWM